MVSWKWKPSKFPGSEGFFPLLDWYQFTFYEPYLRTLCWLLLSPTRQILGRLQNHPRQGLALDYSSHLLNRSWRRWDQLASRDPTDPSEMYNVLACMHSQVCCFKDGGFVSHSAGISCAARTRSSASKALLCNCLVTTTDIPNLNFGEPTLSFKGTPACKFWWRCDIVYGCKLVQTGVINWLVLYVGLRMCHQDVRFDWHLKSWMDLLEGDERGRGACPT